MSWGRHGFFKTVALSLLIGGLYNSDRCRGILDACRKRQSKIAIATGRRTHACPDLGQVLA